MYEAVMEFFAVFREPPDRVALRERAAAADLNASSQREVFREVLAECDTRPKSGTLDDVRDRLEVEDKLIRKALGDG
jgi:hypothetical protein